MTVHRKIFYSGHVQGVGFRYTVKQISTGYEVTGWVRNLADGRVETWVKGDQGEVERFLSAVAASHLRSHIHERKEGGNAGIWEETHGFEIRR